MKKFWQENKSALKFIFLVFIIWTAAVNLLDFVSPYIKIPLRGGYNYSEFRIVNPPFFWNRASFDGIHYLDISRKGYGINQQAFFPLYPQIIKTLRPTFENKDLLAGLFVSHVSLIILLVIFYTLIKIDHETKIARKSLLYLMIFPTSFYFGFVYTESLFLALILGSFLAARKQKWLIAGILGGLAANTRLVGVFLFPALMYEWYEQYKPINFSFKFSSNLFDKLKNFIPLLIIPLGLLSYMRFLKIKFSDPLLFIHSQPFFGANRSGGKIILIYQVFFRYLKMILTTKIDPLYFAVWLELLTAILFIFLLFKAYKKKIRLSYIIFALLALITPTLTGTFSSLPRYVLVLFPCFMYLGTVKDSLLRKGIMAIFLALAIFSALLFFRGYWIA